MREADLQKMGNCLDEVRRIHKDLVEGIKIIHRQLALVNKQLELMEDEFHIASRISEPEN